MKPFIIFEFANGHQYAVPTIIIAQDRAKNYAAEFGGDVERSLKEDTAPLFAGDAYAITDWAKNNMNWAELVPHARLVGYRQDGLAEAFGDAATHCVDELPAVPAIAGENILQMPLEAILANMVQNPTPIYSILIESSDHQHKLGLNIIRGQSFVVDGYLGVINAFSAQLQELAAAAAAQAAGATIAPGSTATN